MQITTLATNYATAAQILPQHVQQLADSGFVAIICNRPDNEDAGQPSAADIAAACEAAGLSFHHIPVTGMPIPEQDIAEHRRVIDEAGGPVLGYCRSGQRSMVIWRASV